MDFESKNNAREALNNLKMEISSELGYHYNMRTDNNRRICSTRNIRWTSSKYKSKC